MAHGILSGVMSMSAPVMASRTVDDLEPGMAGIRELDESSDASM